MKSLSRTDELRHNLWVLWHYTSDLAEKCAESTFGKTGLSYQKYKALLLLKYSPGPVKVSDLARELNRNINSVTEIVDRMERDGLVNLS